MATGPDGVGGSDQTGVAFDRLDHRVPGGVDTQLNALDADRDLLQAQLNLRQIRLDELLSVAVVVLKRAAYQPRRAGFMPTIKDADFTSWATSAASAGG
jgi:hypothetical protein